jgi:hypothetical protein
MVETASTDMSIRYALQPDRTGPMTWGQRKVLREYVDHPDDEYLPFIPFRMDVPAGVSLDSVRTALTRLIVACESLRTVYPNDHEQCVTGSGQLRVDIVEADDPDGAAEALLHAFCARRFDLAVELPLRAAIVTSRGEPASIVSIFSHMAVDGVAVRLLADQLEALLRTPHPPLPSSCQPLELAAAQQSEAGQRGCARALRYWEDVYFTAPQAMLPVPRETFAEPRYCTGLMTSPALAEAVASVADRTRTSKSTVMMAAVATLLGRQAELDRCAITAISSNRSSKQTADLVGTLSQDALVLIDLAAPSFDALVRKAWPSALEAYANALVDPAAQAAVRDRVGQTRGVYFSRDFVYSDLSWSDPAELRAARQRQAGPAPVSRAGRDRTRIHVADAKQLWVRGYFTVLRFDEVVEVSLLANCNYLSPSDIKVFLKSLERFLVTAAELDLPRGVMVQLAEVRPAPRGPQWVRTNSSWVDLDQVQALLDSAVGPGMGRVYPEPAGTGSGEMEIVARLAASALLRTPTQIHAACAARLRDFDSAATPTRYVLYTGVPTDPSEPAAWFAMDVVDAGPGR